MASLRWHNVPTLAQPAGANIVYTPTHATILGPHGFHRLDINNDGITDFTLRNTTSHNTDQGFWNLSEHAVAGNAVAGTFVYRGFPENAHAFNKGDQIGASQVFFQGQEKLVSFYSGGGGYSARGNWINLRDRYLGLKFQIAGQTHFGWARFSVQVLTGPVRINATLTGYAYETTADTPIIAGQTSSPSAQDNSSALQIPAHEPAMLGLLAMGSPALSIWRREESGAAVQ